MISQSDRLDHTTSFQYDNLGRVIEITQALAALTPPVTFTYQSDAAGHRTANILDTNQNGRLHAGDTDVTQYRGDHRNRLVKVEHRAGYAAAVDRVIENAYDFQNRSHPPAAGRRRGRAHRPASPLRLRRQPDRPGLLAEQWPTRLTSRRREPAVRTWRQVVNGSAFPPRADARGSIRPKR